MEEDACWALLAALAVEAGQLEAAEAAFAALELPDQLAWVQSVQRIPSHEGRAAALLAYRKQPVEAEALLLKVGAPDACGATD